MKREGENHIFYEHLLQPQHTAPVPNIKDIQIWPSVFLFFCLVLLTLVKQRAFTKVTRVIQSTFSPQTLQKLEREETNPFKFYSLALNFLYILNVSFLIYKANTEYKLVLVEMSYLSQFGFFFMIIVMAIFIKIILNYILAFFTGRYKVISEYNTSSMFINQSFGLFLLPLIILMEFSPFHPLAFILTSLIVLGFGILLKWYRGVIMGLVEERVGLLQIFSYFCGLEILPVFVLVKYIIETF